jgi:ankyrin repeat protein
MTASKGYDQIARALLTERADVNVADNTGWTALHFAAQDGYESVVALLLTNGAKVNATEKEDKALLHFAALMGPDQVVELLTTQGAFSWSRVFRLTKSAEAIAQV